MLGFVLIFLIPSCLRSLYVIFIKKKEKQVRCLQLLLWFIACVAVIVHHVYLYHSTRDFADKVAIEIIQYKQKHGDYPANIAEVGYKKEDFKPYWLHYSYEADEDPFLIYAATWIVFDAYIYNFETNTWKYKGS